MTYKKKKTVLPIYLIGIVWLLWALFGSLYRTSDYILCAGVSLAAYYIGKIIWPDRGFAAPDSSEAEQKTQEKEKTVKEKKPKSTGNPEIDALIAERSRAVSEMRRLNDSIKDPKISAQIDHLELVAGKIIDTVVAEPTKLPQIRRFMSYYLPTTMKLLNAYDRMDSAGVAGENISGTKVKIEDMLDTICTAFDRQLDALYGAEALDISTDITVMEQMLAREGLGGTQMGGQA